MSDMNDRIEELKTQIVSLKNELLQKEHELSDLERNKKSEECSVYSSDLTTNEVSRYSRQMLVPSFGTKGQLAVQKANVLIVGAGGLGCPCALYLASAGIGNLTIVDNDDVELSNLHRQILHGESDAGRPKVKSAYDNLHSLNNTINIIPVHMHANSSTIANLFQSNKYDVVIDGSDNVATRYLLNDACVLNNVPLVSGSALQMEGQLTVYNYKGGPCYRCIFPVPPPPETVTSCGDGGVLGPVPGTIGVLQALETIKILSAQDGVLSGRLLTFDGSDTTFRNIKLRKRNVNCSVCGEFPSVTSLIDYEQFCGAKADDKIHNISILSTDEQIHVRELTPRSGRLLIDVRPTLEYDMCHLPDSINVPYSDIQKPQGVKIVKDAISKITCKEVLVICRRGNDSQRAIWKLKDALADCSVMFKNVRGGLHSYSKHVDSAFPVY